MMLKADRLAEHLEQGARPETNDPLVITPKPDLDALKKSGAASIDLRLGTWFVSLRQAKMGHLAIEHHAVESQLTRRQYVSFGDQYYLHPRSFVLGVTLEWIRLPRNMGAYVVGRSSWGRRGLIIATATGVHPGFRGCLTLELTNVGELPIEIKPGMAVCQLCVHKAESSSVERSSTSQFIGSRLPSLGSVKLDGFAEKLSKSRII